MLDERPVVNGDESMHCRRDRRMQAGYGEGRFSPTDQRQQTLQISRHYLSRVAVTIGGKVDTAETGVCGDFELSTVAPLDKIDPPFLYVVICRKFKKLTVQLPCTLWHPGKMHERCGGDVTG